MNEITKLYNNAGVEKSKCWDDCNTCTRLSCDKNISYVKAEYPPFTTEKQIELIKWLVKNQDIFKITYHREFLWCSSIEWVESDCYEEFEESLADLINTIWQDLTEEEKQQVRNILNE